MRIFGISALIFGSVLPLPALAQLRLGPFFWLDPAFVHGARSAIASARSAIASGSAGATRAGRFCIRQTGAKTCDFRNGNNAYETARTTVEPRFSVRRTRSPTLFEVIDAVGNVLDILEVIDRFSDPSVDQVPQAAPPPSADSMLVHNRTGQVLQWRVYGVGCPWTPLNHPANAWAHVHCPASQRFVAEIDMHGPLYNQVITRRYELASGIEYELQMQGGTYGNWTFVPVAK